MSPSELAALMRRHALAVTMILLVAAATAYTFKHTPPAYTESATAALMAPNAQPYTSDGPPLLTTAELVVDWFSGAQGQEQVHQAGVAGGFNVELINSSNQQYPYYVVPYLTVSASAHDPATAHRAFAIVIRILNDHLAVLQQRHGVSQRYRMGTRLLGDTGPLVQRGSSKRSFAGLLLLTIVVAYLVLRFLDRYPIRPRALLRSHRRDRNLVARDPLDRQLIATLSDRITRMRHHQNHARAPHTVLVSDRES